MFHQALKSCKHSRIAYYDNKTIHRIYKNSIFYDGCSKGKHDAQGFLYYDANKIHVTFRGTMDPMDAKDIIDIRHEKMFSPSIRVHKGFHNQFFAIEEEITQDIRSIASSYKVDEIIFAGHSLGGAIALLASPYYG